LSIDNPSLLLFTHDSSLMDVGSKRRSIRGKISMPFYRTQKPTAPSAAAPPVQTVAKAVKPVPQEMKPKLEVAGVDAHVDKFKGGDMTSEVDRRAAHFILLVQERLRREQISDEENWR
jgi:hypothetical protein